MDCSATLRHISCRANLDWMPLLPHTMTLSLCNAHRRPKPDWMLPFALNQVPFTLFSSALTNLSGLNTSGSEDSFGSRLIDLFKKPGHQRLEQNWLCCPFAHSQVITYHGTPFWQAVVAITYVLTLIMLKAKLSKLLLKRSVTISKITSSLTKDILVCKVVEVHK